MNERFPSISAMIPDLAHGEQDSWNKLVEMFYPGVCGKARTLLGRSRLGKRVAPEDLANIVFSKAWEKRDSIAAQNTRQFAAFILRILQNSFIDLCRPTNLEESCPSWIVPTGSDDSPSQVMISDEDEAHLHACLAELPSRQQQVLIMRHLDGKKFREIAEALDMTPGAVAGAARDGLKKLTERIDETGGNLSGQSKLESE